MIYHFISLVKLCIKNNEINQRNSELCELCQLLVRWNLNDKISNAMNAKKEVQKGKKKTGTFKSK